MNILSAAADLIEQPNAWCQKAIARNAKGDTLRIATQNSACQWCTIGAVIKACENNTYNTSEVIEKVRQVLKSRTGGDSLGGWNDAPDRTQAEVVALLREAAGA